MPDVKLYSSCISSPVMARSVVRPLIRLASAFKLYRFQRSNVPPTGEITDSSSRGYFSFFVTRYSSYAEEEERITVCRIL